MRLANRLIDTGNSVTIVVTLVLFVVALFVKGFTHDLLLEGGVFLVSVKLILLAYKHEVSTASLEKKIDDIRRLLDRQSR